MGQLLDFYNGYTDKKNDTNLPFMALVLSFILVYSGCHNRTPQTQDLQKTGIISQSMKDRSPRPRFIVGS